MSFEFLFILMKYKMFIKFVVYVYIYDKEVVEFQRSYVILKD